MGTRPPQAFSGWLQLVELAEPGYAEAVGARPDSMERLLPELLPALRE